GRGLGAVAHRIGGVLDVAADIDVAVVGEDGGADLEVAVGRIGPGAHGLGGGEKLGVTGMGHGGVPLEAEAPLPLAGRGGGWGSIGAPPDHPLPRSLPARGREALATISSASAFLGVGDAAGLGSDGLADE